MKTQPTTHDVTLSGLDPKQFPQTAEFMAWYEAEKQRGLKDIKFLLPIGGNADVTLESVFADVNLALKAPVAKDPNGF